jgi:hypothetical protein
VAIGIAILHYLFEKMGLIDRLQVKIGIMNGLSNVVVGGLEII